MPTQEGYLEGDGGVGSSTALLVPAAYRDLGVATATGGRVGAHVIRARGASTEPGETQRHTLEFQLVYVLRGWGRV